MSYFEKYAQNLNIWQNPGLLLLLKAATSMYMNKFDPCLISVDGAWNSWSTWGACPLTCGPSPVGEKRQRSCQGQQHNGVDTCDPTADDEEEFRPCTNDPCPPGESRLKWLNGQSAGGSGVRIQFMAWLKITSL